MSHMSVQMTVANPWVDSRRGAPSEITREVFMEPFWADVKSAIAPRHSCSEAILIGS